jgi:hypothetical protein
VADLLTGLGLAAAAPVDPDDARRAAEDILARPEFQPEPRSLLDRFLDWLGQRLPDLNPRSPSTRTPEPGRGGMGLVTWLLIIGAVALLGWLAWRIARSERVGRRRKRSGDDVEEALLDPAATPTTLDGLAARFEAEGRWREAVLMRYRGTVGRIGDAGLVVAVPGRTTGELRGDVRAVLGEQIGPFDDLTDLVEAGWYAGHPLEQAHADHARELATTVAAQAAAHAAVRRGHSGDDVEGDVELDVAVPADVAGPPPASGTTGPRGDGGGGGR